MSEAGRSLAEQLVRGLLTLLSLGRAAVTRPKKFQLSRRASCKQLNTSRALPTSPS